MKLKCIILITLFALQNNATVCFAKYFTENQTDLMKMEQNKIEILKVFFFHLLLLNLN